MLNCKPWINRDRRNFTYLTFNLRVNYYSSPKINESIAKAEISQDTPPFLADLLLIEIKINNRAKVRDDVKREEMRDCDMIVMIREVGRTKLAVHNK